MKKKSIGILMVVVMIFLQFNGVFCSNVYAKEATGNNYDVSGEDLVKSVLGSGLQATNIVKKGTIYPFSNGKDRFGIESGIILDNSGIIKNEDTDSDLESLMDFPYGGDTSSLEFTITATGNLLNFEYVFASQEFICSPQFNDVFGLFVSVNGSEYENIATIERNDGEVVPVNITNLKNGLSNDEFVEIPEDGKQYSLYKGFAVSEDDYERDSLDHLTGISNVFTAKKPVNVGDTVKVKFVIADVSDDAVGSFVFIKGNSLSFEEKEDNENTEKYTVTFDTNRGSKIKAQTVEEGSKANKPSDPTKTGYKFVDWYTDKELTTPFDFSTPITSDITLYAKWNFDVVAKPEDDTTISEEVTQEINTIIKDIVDGKEVKGVDEELAEKIIEGIANGDEITIEVGKTKVDEADVKDDLEKIKEKIGNDSIIAGCYDIDVNVLLNKVKVGNISELDNKITIVLDKPTVLPEVQNGYKRVFKIASLHEGQVIEYETTDNGDTVSCEAGLFSTFTVSYDDVKVSTNTANTSSNPKAGDNIVIWISLMVVSLLGFAGTVKFVKKNK